MLMKYPTIHTDTHKMAFLQVHTIEKSEKRKLQTENWKLKTDDKQAACEGVRYWNINLMLGLRVECNE